MSPISIPVETLRQCVALAIGWPTWRVLLDTEPRPHSAPGVGDPTDSVLGLATISATQATPAHRPDALIREWNPTGGGDGLGALVNALSCHRSVTASILVELDENRPVADAIALAETLRTRLGRRAPRDLLHAANLGTASFPACVQAPRVIDGRRYSAAILTWVLNWSFDDFDPTEETEIIEHCDPSIVIT